MDDLIPDRETADFLQQRWAAGTSYQQEQILAALDDFLLDKRGEPDDPEEDWDDDDEDWDDE